MKKLEFRALATKPSTMADITDTQVFVELKKKNKKKESLLIWS